MMTWELLLILTIELVTGIGPALVILLLERKLAKLMLKKAERVADRALDQAKAENALAIKRIDDLRVQIFDDLDDKLDHVATKITLDVDTKMKNFKVVIPDDEIQKLEDRLAERITHTIDGKLGAEVKQLKNELANDPRAAEMMMQAGMQPTIMERLLEKFLK